MSVLPSILAMVLVCLVPGVPLALLLLREVRPGASVVLVTAAGVGLATWQAIGFPLVHHGRFDAPTLAISGIALALVAWIPARRHVGVLRPRRPRWLGALLALLAVPAVLLRDSPIYFIYQVADFGEYVNRANFVADGGRFGGWFVNGFPLLLAESHLLVGEAAHVHAMPFLGLLTGAILLAACRIARVPDVVLAALAVVWVVHVQSVWFGQFPASEVPYAAFLALSLLLAAAAIRSGDARPAVAGGLLGFALVVTRGNGLVYLPMVVGGLAIVPLLVGASSVRILRLHLFALTAGLWSGTLYDARFNPTYFLDAQAGTRLPGAAGDAFVRLDEPLVAVALSVVVAVLAGAAAALGSLLERLRDRPGALPLLRRSLVGGAVAVAVAAHLVVIPSAQWRPRYEVLGVAVAVPLVLAVAVWLRDRVADDVARYLLGWTTLVGLAMTTFQASRLIKSVTVDGPWFLYWDRYFFSEVFPLLLLAGAVAAGTLVAQTRRRSPTNRAPSALAGVFVLAVLWDQWGPVSTATEREMFADTYDEFATIDSLLAGDLPVVYDGTPVVPDEWIWSNTVRTVLQPLEQTFPNRFLNRDPLLRPDPRPRSWEIARLLADAGFDEGYVLQTHHDGTFENHDGPWLDAEVVGELLMPVERLKGATAVRPEHQRWVTSTLHVRVLRVVRTTATAAVTDVDAEVASSG